MGLEGLPRGGLRKFRHGATKVVFETKEVVGLCLLQEPPVRRRRKKAKDDSRRSEIHTTTEDDLFLINPQIAKNKNPFGIWPQRQLVSRINDHFDSYTWL